LYTRRRQKQIEQQLPEYELSTDISYSSMMFTDYNTSEKQLSVNPIYDDTPKETVIYIQEPFETYDIEQFMCESMLDVEQNENPNLLSELDNVVDSIKDLFIDTFTDEVSLDFEEFVKSFDELKLSCKNENTFIENYDIVKYAMNFDVQLCKMQEKTNIDITYINSARGTLRKIANEATQKIAKDSYKDDIEKVRSKLRKVTQVESKRRGTCVNVEEDIKSIINNLRRV
jgi:hypothetical protein